MDSKPAASRLLTPASPAPPEPRAPLPPPVVPDHDLLRPIGQGSYGVVWLARNVMGLFRAVKIVYRRDFADDRPFEREFSGIQKFEPLSRSHDGFVDILHIGRNQTDGYFYYVMELADPAASNPGEDGTNPPVPDHPDSYSPRTLKSERDRLGRLPVEDCLQIGLNLASALDCLHQNGLVHRDVKPSNIIFVNGRPKLADIGLVAPLADARSFVGTEGFIPPEGPGTPQADIYSLGKVLYEISSGKDRHAFPEPPTRLGELPDQTALLELDEVVQRACATDPARRYQSAQRMCDDLLLLQAGKSVRQLRKTERRLALVTQLALAALAVGLLVTGGLVLQHLEAVKARDAANREKLLRQEADLERQRADANAAQARSLLARHYVSEGNRLVSEGSIPDSLPWFAAALDLVKDDAVRREVARLRLRLAFQQCPRLTQLCIHEDRIRHAEFSPDGRWIATAGLDGKTGIWDAASGAPARVLLQHTNKGHPGTSASSRHVSFSPDGRRFVTATGNSEAQVWDLETGSPVTPPLLHAASVNWAEFSPDGDCVATASKDGTARVWDSTSGKPVTGPLRMGPSVFFASFSPDSRLLAVGSGDTAAIWDAASGQCVLPGLRSSVPTTLCVAFSPDSRRVLLPASDSLAHLYDIATGKDFGSLNDDSMVLYAAFTPCGDRIVTGDTGKLARLWDAPTLKPVGLAFHNSHYVRGVACTSNEQVLVTSVADASTRVWETATGKPLAGPVHQLTQSLSVFLNPDGRRFFTLSSDRDLAVWDCAGGEPAADLFHLAPCVWDAAFSPNGRLVVALGPDHGALLLDLKSGKDLTPDFPILPSVRSAQFSPDGRILALGSLDGLVELWDLQTPTAAQKSFRHGGPVNHVEFSPDGKMLLSAGGDATVCIWEVASGNALPRLPHPGPVALASFSPDANRVVTVTLTPPRLSEWATAVAASVPAKKGFYARATQLQSWDWKTGTRLGSPLVIPSPVSAVQFSPDRRRALFAAEKPNGQADGTLVADLDSGSFTTNLFVHGPGRLGEIHQACFSPDGRRVLTAGLANNARIWDAATGESLCPPLQHEQRVYHASFSSDGRLVATASLDGTTRMWDADSGEPVGPPLKRRLGSDMEIQPDGPLRVFFAPDGGHLLIADATGQLWSWSLPITARPVKDDLLLSELLSFHHVDRNGIIQPSDPSTIEAAWQKLRLACRADFEPTPSQIQAWNQEFGLPSPSPKLESAPQSASFPPPATAKK